MRAPNSTQRRSSICSRAPAVALQLDHVFTGIRMRRGEEEHQALVDRGSVCCTEMREVRVARSGHAARQVAADVGCERAGDAHDADPAAPRGRGDGGDGLAARVQRRAFAFASFSSVRLMCHCCRIDSRFCTTQ